MRESHIVGVHIPAYKNLTDVWVPWSDGLALVGPNGAGKTNLLEALALLIGTTETLRLAGSRLDKEAAPGLSIIVRNDPQALPVGPGTLGRVDLSGFGQRTAQVNRDLAWWQREGVRSGETFSEALSAWDVPAEVKPLCIEAMVEPLVQYTLQSMTNRHQGDPLWWCPECDEPTAEEEPTCERCGADTVVEHTQVVAEERVYRRTLLTTATLGPLPDLGDSPALSMLGTSIVGPDELTALIELPLTTKPPALLQWLPRARSGTEVAASLKAAFVAALHPTESFIDELGTRLPVTQEPVSGDVHWWLHQVATAAANEELSHTAAPLFVESSGADDADWFLGVSAPDGGNIVVGRTLDSPLERFSAGQRRWMDEALATASRALTRHAERAKLFRFVLSDLDDDTITDAVVEAAELVHEAEREGWWSGDAIDAVLAALEPALVALATAKDAVNPGTRAILRAVLPEFEQLDKTVVVRVLDEPEAHLHVGAERTVSAALQSLRYQGQNIVVATHSPAFIDLDGWKTLHVREGAVSDVPQLSRQARRRLATNLGITRGELLSGIASILVVEGLHDQMVLEALYGSELREAGVAVVRMLGTDYLLATVDLDFIERYVDVPMAVMLDYTRTERIRAGKPITDEEKKLAYLKKSAKRKGYRFDVIGLVRPDVTCYLHETAIRQLAPSFVGWKRALERFESLRNRPSFKPWLHNEFGVDLTTTRNIDRVLSIMVDEGLSPVGDLAQKVNEFLATTSGRDAEK